MATGGLFSFILLFVSVSNVGFAASDRPTGQVTLPKPLKDRQLSRSQSERELRNYFRNETQKIQWATEEPLLFDVGRENPIPRRQSELILDYVGELDRYPEALDELIQYLRFNRRHLTETSLQVLLKEVLATHVKTPLHASTRARLLAVLVRPLGDFDSGAAAAYSLALEWIETATPSSLQHIVQALWDEHHAFSAEQPEEISALLRIALKRNLEFPEGTIAVKARLLGALSTLQFDSSGPPIAVTRLDHALAFSRPLRTLWVQALVQWLNDRLQKLPQNLPQIPNDVTTGMDILLNGHALHEDTHAFVERLLLSGKLDELQVWELRSTYALLRSRALETLASGLSLNDFTCAESLTPITLKSKLPN